MKNMYSSLQQLYSASYISKSIVLFEINISWISLMLNSTSNSNDNLCKIVFISIRYGDDFNFRQNKSIRRK